LRRKGYASFKGEASAEGSLHVGNHESKLKKGPPSGKGPSSRLVAGREFGSDDSHLSYPPFICAKKKKSRKENLSIAVKRGSLARGGKETRRPARNSTSFHSAKEKEGRRLGGERTPSFHLLKRVVSWKKEKRGKGSRLSGTNRTVSLGGQSLISGWGKGEGLLNFSIRRVFPRNLKKNPTKGVGKGDILIFSEKDMNPIREGPSSHPRDA